MDLLEQYRLGGGNIVPALCFSFICGTNTTKLGMMVLLGQNLSKAIKILLTSSLGGKYDVIKLYLVLFQIKIRVHSSFIFCPIELKCGTGVNSEALSSNPGQNIRYKYVWKEKNANFYEKLKVLPKHSLTNVLPWQHPRLLLTANHFK